MARGINKVIVVGNLGRDPEIKHAASGSTIANFSIAVNETWKDKTTGEKQEKTEWVRCCAFNRLAEIIEQYVTKGQQVYVEGKMQTRSWEQDGVTKYMTEVVVHELQMLGGRGDGAAPARPAQAQQANGFRDQAPPPPPLSQQAAPLGNDDIPF